jgi:hypothetical protein
MVSKWRVPLRKCALTFVNAVFDPITKKISDGLAPTLSASFYGGTPGDLST